MNARFQMFEIRLLDALFESSHTPIAYMDLNFNFIRVNQAYAAEDNKSPDFFPGKNHFELYPHPENQKIFQNVVRTGKPYKVEAKVFEYPDDKERAETFWDWSLILITNEENDAVGVLLQLLNVTSKINLEQKLHQKVKDDLLTYDKELETIIENRTRLLQEAIEHLKIENKERVKAEQLMYKAKAEAERANISKSQFLSRMSHELRTPLNAILGFSQLLSMGSLDDEQQSSNSEIMTAGNHLLSMLTDILELSRIETGDYAVNIKDFSLNNIVYESIALVKHKLKFKNVEIHNLLSTEDDISLRLDETRFKEVLVNLLTNAIKYNTDNGLVSVSYKKIDNKNIRIYVSDTGKGLSKEEQKEIFEPFNRIGAEYTDIEGVGIGLTIAKKLMELMGGSIGIESDKGRGSSFYLDCPLGDKVQLPENIPLVDNFTFKLENDLYKILYVEDNKSNQSIIKKLLAVYDNIDLIISADAEDGFNQIEQQDFDLIILDINLPGMNGYEILKYLKENDKTKDIPVVALTAAASEHDIKKGLAAGFNQYMTKPVKLSDFMSMIQNELNTQPHQ